MKKKICLTVLLLIAAFMFASCTKKSETDKGPYPQILAGDLSAFAETWVNGYGWKARLFHRFFLHDFLGFFAV